MLKLTDIGLIQKEDRERELIRLIREYESKPSMFRTKEDHESWIANIQERDALSQEIWKHEQRQ